MINVSDAWKAAHQHYLLPESFIEISVGLTDVGVADEVTITADNESVLSNTDQIVANTESVNSTNYALLEYNLWVLDGTKVILPDDGSYNCTGFVSEDDSDCTVVLTLPEPREKNIPGFTIVWSDEYGEYPTSFTLSANDVTTGEFNTRGFLNNKSNVVEIDMPISNYDTVKISIGEWSKPEHRKRLDRISFGHVVVFGKSDIFSYNHTQSGCMNSGELPKNSIEFTMDNTDGRWNPNNPVGIEKYLSERQEVNVRYGFQVGDNVEWIKAGTFYLSEWRAPSNGLEATFVARDIFEFMLNETYTGITSGTLREFVDNAIAIADLPRDVVLNIDPVLDTQTGVCESEHTVAEIIQMCANAACCVIWQDRDGALNIRSLPKTHSGYNISMDFAYSHPEVELFKPLKAVSVEYGTDYTNYTENVAATGEKQTVTNELIGTENHAIRVATWVKNTLEQRKTVTGEFRADPRLDVFDVVSVDSKFGVVNPVVITEISYDYTGSFKATYTGRVIALNDSSSVLGEFMLGKSVLGG